MPSRVLMPAALPPSLLPALPLRPRLPWRCPCTILAVGTGGRPGPVLPRFPPALQLCVRAPCRCKCLTLSRDAFERLMGPVEQSLAQQIAAYAQSNAETSAVAAATAGARSGAAAAGHGDGKGEVAASARQRAPTPPPVFGCGGGSPTRGSGTAGSAAALLPGSPRLRGRSSDQGSPGGYGWRRSRRGTGSEAGDSPGSQCSSPLASLLASHEAHGAAPQGAAAGGEPADGDGAEPEPLPTIVEEPTLDAAGATAAVAAAAEFAAAADAQERAAAGAAARNPGKAAPRPKARAASIAASKGTAAKRHATVAGQKKLARK